MANLKTGSSGSEVKKMQEALIKAGYDVGNTKADGVFGNNTLAAVKQYQKDNGLAVDGIAGPKTLGKMYAVTADGDVANSRDPLNSDKPKQEPAAGTPRTEVPSFSHNPYAKSDVVQQAETLLQQHNASAPAYSSQWQAQINAYLNKIMNRDPFSYNFNEDALYQQYKDIYTQMGLMAMMDTMGQASAMTGGYGNSYAQTVGQQAYNQQLSQLNNVLPELYQMAYDRYAYEGDQLYQQYGLLMDQENLDYNRYMDSYNQWADTRDYLAGQANMLYQQDYNQYKDSYAQAWDEYTMEYKIGRDQVGDEQWQQEFDRNGQNTDYNRLVDLITTSGYVPSEAELAAAGMTKEQAAAYKNYYDTAKTADADKGNGNGNNEPAVKYTEFTYEEQSKWDKEFQKADSLPAVERAADRMAQAGIDPQIVAQWYDYYAAKFMDKEPEPPAAPPKKTGGNGGGGGGGVTMIDHR